MSDITDPLPASPEGPLGDSERQLARTRAYLRAGVARLLEAIDAPPLSPEKLSDEKLLSSDPLGYLEESVREVLARLDKTAERLRLVHEDMRAVFDLAGVALLVVDNDFNVMAHNKLAQEDFGDGSASMIYRRCFEIICKNGEPPEYCTVKDVIALGKRAERKGLRMDQKIFDVVATPVLDDGGNLLHTVLTYVNITDRMKAMEALAESEKRYRDLFENANDLIQVASADGSILYVNSAWKKATGHLATEALNISALIPPEHRDDYANAVLAARKREGGVRIETEFLTADGRRLLLDGNISCATSEEGETLVRAIFRDITRQRRLEEEISTAQRMDTVGQLAGGIAHDFNNALTSILGNISLAKMYEASGYQVRDKLEKAEQAVIRARGLTRQLLTFSTGGAPVKKELNLVPFVADSVSFTLSGSNVRAEFQLAKELRYVEVDSGQFEQVLQNLVLNAVQAMPGGGVVTVECANVQVDDASPLPLPHGDYVRITVADKGVGIPESHLDRIFDPFFTTKDGGKGLGLASAFSIVRKHGGTINVESELGTGTRFDVYLPAKERREAPRGTLVREGGVGGRILVMDDETDIRELLDSLLTHLGYSVASAPDGETAEKMYRKALEAMEPYDIVIMDLTVPGGMGGLELMKRLLRIDPKTVGIVSSGYSSDPVMSDYSSYGFSGVAAKPYRLESLTGLVASLVGRRGTSRDGRQ